MQALIQLHTVALMASALCLPALSASANCTACNALPGMADRIVPIRGVAIHNADARQRAKDFKFKLSESEAALNYTVLISVDDPSAALAISLNGTQLSPHPIQTKQGLWFFVPAEALKAGDNLLTMERLEGTLHPADTMTLLSLEPGEEDLHYGRFIKASITKDQPPLDPSQEQMDVLHLDLDMTLNMTSATIAAASATITAESLDNALSQCVLDLNDNGGQLTVSAVDDGAGNALAFNHNGTQERLYITLPAAVPAGNTFTVRVFYSGTPLQQFGDQGMYFSTHGSANAPVLYTNSQAYSARCWWPGKDVPADKFTANVSLTVPDASYDGWPLFAVSNGELVSTVDNGSTITYNWEERHNIASYLLAVTVSNYRPAEGVYTAGDGVTTMPMIHYLYPEIYSAESPEVPNTIDLIEYFSDLFGEYPFVDEKYATVTWPLTYGLEHQTVTSMPTGNLSTPNHRRNIHELAHMWFGDYVTYDDYSQLWLGEGWASYCEALAFGHLNGQSAYFAYLNGWNLNTTRPVVDPSQDNFDTSTFRSAYYKGAWVLHMLRHVVGDEDFFAATRLYLQTRAYDTATSDQFQQAYETQTGGELDYFFTQWLHRGDRPDYTWGWTPRVAGGDTIVDVVVTQNQTAPAYTMPIDIRVEFTDASTETFVVFNSAMSETLSVNVGNRTVFDVSFDPEGWILKDATEISLNGPPDEAPTLLAVSGDLASGTMRIDWTPTGEVGLTGYRVYASPDGTGSWTQLADESTLGATDSTFTATGFSDGDTRFFKVVAVRGSEGPESDVYGARIDSSGSKALLVDSYDRWVTQTSHNPTGANHNFLSIYGRAVQSYSWPFDSCANEYIAAASQLQEYPVVVWMCGEDSTADESFSTAEQTRVASYLDNGGKLFVSGNEIAWDLGRTNRPIGDQDFYANYLKAAYELDKAEDPSVPGAVDYTVTFSGIDSIFFTDSYSYGDGGDAPYNPLFPDVIGPVGGARVELEYQPPTVDGGDNILSYNGAAIGYQGTFGSSAIPGAVVYMGFAFETVYPEAGRDLLMKRVLDSFSDNSNVSQESWVLF